MTPGTPRSGVVLEIKRYVGQFKGKDFVRYVWRVGRKSHGTRGRGFVAVAVTETCSGYDRAKRIEQASRGRSVEVVESEVLAGVVRGGLAAYLGLVPEVPALTRVVAREVVRA